MALQLVNSGTTDIGDSSPWTLAQTVTFGTYSAVLDLTGFVDCTLGVWWAVEMTGRPEVPVWGEQLNLTGTSIALGLIVPPLPVARHGYLKAQLSAGTPSDSVVEWDLFSL